MNFGANNTYLEDCDKKEYNKHQEFWFSSDNY